MSSSDADSSAESTLSLNSETFRKLSTVLPEIREVDLEEIPQVRTLSIQAPARPWFLNAAIAI